MERITPSQSDLINLGNVLSDASVPTSSESALPAVDPAVELAAERAQVLQAAREEGLAQGAMQAEQAINEQVAAIEAQLTERHHAQVEALELEQERLAVLIRAVPEALRAMDDDVAAVVAEVAYRAVVRVIGQQWAERDVLTDLCRRLSEENRLSPAIMRVAPEDVHRVSCATADLQVVADAQLVPGQCVIESGKGRLITGLDVRLNALRDALLDGLKQPVRPS